MRDREPGIAGVGPCVLAIALLLVPPIIHAELPDTVADAPQAVADDSRAQAKNSVPGVRPLAVGEPLPAPSGRPADDELDGPETDPLGPFATLPVVSEELERTIADAAADDPIRVIIQLRHLPHDRIAAEVAGRHAHERAAIERGIRDVLAEYAARRDATMSADAENFPELIVTFPQEREELRSLNGELEALDLLIKNEMAAELTAELAPFIARVRSEVERLGGEFEFNTLAGSLVIATIPAGRIAELGGHPDILAISEDRLLESDLSIMDDATRVSGTGGLWDSGETGGLYDPAVIDSGTDLGHPCMADSTSPLRNNYYSWYLVAAAGHPFYADAADEDDRQGHGTHVAGIVACYGNNYPDQLGMSYGVEKLVTLKAGFLRSDTGRASMYWSDKYNIVDRALYNDHQLYPTNTFNDDVDGMNLSYSGETTDDDTAASRFWDSAISTYSNLPVTLSAGNSGPSNANFNDPAISYNAITVANVDDQNTAGRDDDVARWSSSVGPTANGRRKPDIAAPGTDIYAPNNDWETELDHVDKSGTSMSAPSVLGVLMDLMDGGVIDELELKALLINTAQKNEPGIGIETDPDGWDDQIGWGYMNAWAAYYHRADVITSSVTPRNTSGEYRLFKGSMRDEGAVGEGRDRVTMVWNRHATYNTAAPPTTYYSLSDLNLRLYRESDEYFYDYDTTPSDNVHQVRIDAGESATDVIVKAYAWSTSFAHGGATESFALATEEGFTEVDLPSSFGAGGSIQGSIEPGETVDLSVRITNNSEIASHDNVFDLNLPAGWTRVSGSEVQNVGSAAGGGGSSAWATWSIQAPPAPPTGVTQIHMPHSHNSYNTPFTGLNWYITTTVEWDTTPPTPDPLTFSTPPQHAGTSTISMTATQASDIHDPIEYYFVFGGSPSGGSGGSAAVWQTSRSHTDGGLDPNNEYCYRPYARDSSAGQNQTSMPATECAYTMIRTPLAPAPSAISTSTINAQSQGSFNNLGLDLSGLRIDNQTNGADSGWIQGPVNWNSVGLATNTAYTFSTRARNGDGLEAPIGPPATAYTLIEGPAAPSATPTSATTVDVQSQGSYTNLALGASGLRVDNLTAGTDSGWQQGPVNWTSSGLTPNTLQTFVGRSRNGDGIANPAGPSTAVYTHAAAPAAAGFATLTHTSVTARWAANGNPGGTEYWVENTTTSASSGWTTALEWVDTSTGPSASYTYQGKARNAAGVETSMIPFGTAHTPFFGDGFESSDTSAWSATVP